MRTRQGTGVSPLEAVTGPASLRKPATAIRYSETLRFCPPTLAGLNPEQMELARTLDGPVLALAGPGTGKTETISRRMAWAIESGHTSPERVLMTTFTAEAGEELRARVARRIGRESAEKIAIHTLNALGYLILRRECRELGKRDLRVAIPLAEEIILDLIQGVAEAEDLDPKIVRQIDPNDVREKIGFFKTLGIVPDDAADRWPAIAGRIAGRSSCLDQTRPASRVSFAEFRSSEANGNGEGEGDPVDTLAWLFASTVYGEYVRQMACEDAIDYADQCSMAIGLLKGNPHILARWQERFGLISVDEFQDCDPGQFELVRLLAGEQANLCCIGDDDQTLYPWRLADPAHITGFERWYPKVTVVQLRRVYRCHHQILTAAVNLIANNVNRRPKDLQSLPQHMHGQTRSISAESLPGLAAAVARDLLSERPFAMSQTMLLTRTNRTAEVAAGVLACHGIPVAITAPLVSEPLRLALAAVRLALGRGRAGDIESQLSLMPDLSPPLLEEVQKRSKDKSRRAAQAEAGLKDLDALIELVDGPDRVRLEGLRSSLAELAPESRSGCNGASGEVDGGAGGRVATVNLSTGLNRFWTNNGFRLRRSPLASSPEARAVLAGAKNFTSASTWLQTVEDCLMLDEDGIQVMTGHASKGLEADSVYLFDLSAGCFPADDLQVAALEDERRIAFVMLTRARREAVICTRGRPGLFALEIATRPDPVQAPARETGRSGTPASSAGDDLGVPASLEAKHRIGTAQAWDDDLHDELFGH